MNRGRAGIILFGGAAALGCASSTQPAVSAAVRELHGVDCPDDRVEVLETRDTEDDDTLYEVDACGQKLELTKGYAIPERKNDLSEYSADSGFELPQGMERTVPGGVTAVVRKKVPRWCRAVRPDNPDAIAFNGDSPDECRARLANGVTPLGTERGKNGEPDIYWFALGKYVFAVRESFSTSAAPQKQVVAKTAPTFKRNERTWYARIELGGGYLTTSRTMSDGGSFDFRPQFGPKLNNDFAFGLATAYHIAFSDDLPTLYEIGLATSYYPIPNSGLRLEAAVSASWLRFADTDYSDVGPLFSAAIGYDDGAREKNTTGRWSGGGLTLRGFYATLPYDDATSIALYLTWYSW